MPGNVPPSGGITIGPSRGVSFKRIFDGDFAVLKM
jgi:hypothetical protein